MSEFKTWHEARAYAEARVREIGIPHGIEKPTPYQGWTVKMLPNKSNRCGWELRCEAVEPDEYGITRRAKLARDR